VGQGGEDSRGCEAGLSCAAHETKAAVAVGTLELNQEGAVAVLSIKHSARRNAMTRQMWRDLSTLTLQLGSDVRCLIVRGEGEHFCAGGDISEYPSFRFNETSLAQFHEEEVAPGLDALLSLDIPVLASIDGQCMGGGVEIACCADIRIASTRAMFGAPIAKLGMPMAPRELQLVTRVAGEASVREMLLEARVFDAATLHARGFVQRLCAPERVHQEALETAQRMAALSPQAAKLNKQTIRAIFKLNMPTAGVFINKYATKNIATDDSNDAPAYAYANSAEHREGIQAFLEKRTPKF
jgi:enoyl-CoA hydratase